MMSSDVIHVFVTASVTLSWNHDVGPGLAGPH